MEQLNVYLNAGHSIKDVGASSGAFKENILAMKYRDSLATALSNLMVRVYCVSDMIGLGGAILIGRQKEKQREPKVTYDTKDTQVSHVSPSVTPLRNTDVTRVDPMVVTEAFPTTCPEWHLCLDLHFNAGPPSAQGFEIFTDALRGSPWHTCTTRVLHGIIAHTNQVSRGVKDATQSARGSLGWLTLPHSMLFEIEFLTNPGAMSRMIPPVPWGAMVAKVLVDALRDYHFPDNSQGPG